MVVAPEEWVDMLVLLSWLGHDRRGRYVSCPVVIGPGEGVDMLVLLWW